MREKEVVFKTCIGMSYTNTGELRKDAVGKTRGDDTLNIIKVAAEYKKLQDSNRYLQCKPMM